MKKMNHTRRAFVLGAMALLALTAACAPPEDSLPSDEQGTVSEELTITELLAPAASGQTLTVVHGYNDPLPTETCTIGSSSDHCKNQKYGFDLKPSNQNDLRILAPVSGSIAWISGNCLGLKTNDGYNMNVCHFGSYNVAVGASVSRGKVLGNRSTTWIHISLDDRYRNTTKPPVSFTGTHILQGTGYSPLSDTTRNQYYGQVITSTNTPI